MNKKIVISLSPFAPANLVARDGFGRPVPRISLLILHTQTKPGACSRNSHRFCGGVQLFIPPYAIGSVPSLSSHEMAYRRRSRPRVACIKPEVLKLVLATGATFAGITMGQLIYTSLPHNHCWYETDMCGTVNIGEEIL